MEPNTQLTLPALLLAFGAYKLYNSYVNSPFYRKEKLISYTEEFEHGGDLIADVLKKHGVKFVFTLIGGHISPIIVSSKKVGIRIIDVRHEVNAVFAADAVSRLSEVPGVACVTAGPGLTNTITAVKNAKLAQSPLILLGGATSTFLKGRGSLQDIDQQSLFAPHVKWQASIKRVRDIIPIMDKAFAIASSGVPGPVFIELPLDILYPEKLQVDELNKTLNKTDLFTRIAKWYVTYHLSTVFGGKDTIKHSSPYEITYNKPSSRQISSAANMIAKSKKPVIVCGSQTVCHVDNIEKIQTSLNELKIPVYLMGMCRGLMGHQNPLQMRHKRRDALKECDVVIVLGVPLDFRLKYGQAFGKHTKVISINLDHEDLFKNRTPDLAILADPGTFIIEIQKALQGKWQPDSTFLGEWTEKLRERDNARDAEILKQSEEKANQYMNPLKVCQIMSKKTNENTIFVADGGDFVACASYIVRPPKPLTWLDPGVFGTLGVGAGFALGAKLCRPEAEVWLVWGDGTAGYSIMEYDTFVRHNVPIISLIGNDACWAQIERDQTKILKDDVGCMLAYSDYQKISEDLGGKGYIAKDDAELEVAVDKAIQDIKGENAKPVIINALIGKTNFREGSISI